MTLRTVLYQPLAIGLRGNVPSPVVPGNGAAGYGFDGNRSGSPRQDPNVTQQQFAAFQPRGAIGPPPPPYGAPEGYGYEADLSPSLAHRLEAAQQQHQFWQPIYPTTAPPLAVGHTTEIVLRTTVAETDHGVPPFLPIVRVPPGAQGYEWTADLSAPLPGRIEAAQQQWAYFQPRDTIFSVTPQGWWQPLDARIKRPFFEKPPWDFPWQQPAVPPTPTPSILGWPNIFDRNYVPPFKAALQQHMALQPIYTVTYPPLVAGHSTEIFLRTIVGETDSAVPPFVQVVGTATPITWIQAFHDQGKRPPEATKPQFSAFQPRGAIVSVTPQGWWPQSGSERFVKPKPSDYAIWPTQFVPSVAQVYGAAGYEWSPERFPLYSGQLEAAHQMFRAFTPLGTIISTTPQGWWQPLAEAKIRPLKTSLLEGVAFPPRAFVVAQPYGANAFFDSIKAPLFGVDTNTKFANFWPAQPPVVVQPYGAAGFFDFAKTPSLGADTAMRFAPFVATLFVQPAGAQGFEWMPDRSGVPQQVPNVSGQVHAYWPPMAPAVVQPYGAQGYEWAADLQGEDAKPNVTQQQWTGWQAMGNVPSPVTPYGWWVPLDANRVAPFKAALQRFDRSPPDKFIPGTSTQAFLGHWPSFDWLLAKPFKASAQQHTAFQPQGTIVSITPQGWSTFHDRGSRPPSAALQRHEAFQPLGTIVTAVFYGWSAFHDAMPRQARAVTAQPFQSEWLSPTAVTVSGFLGPLSEPTRRRPAAADFSVFGTAAVAVATPQGWTVLFDVRFVAPLRASVQQHAAFQPLGTITVATPQGWTALFDMRVMSPLKPTQQQHGSFQPLGSIGLTPQGWSTFHDRARYGAIAPDRFWGWPIQPPAVLAPQFGWWQPFPELLRQKFRPAFQQYSIQAFFQVPTAATPQGWWQPLSVTYIKPVAVTLQRWADFQPLGFILAPDRIFGRQQLLGSTVKPSLSGSEAKPGLRGSTAKPGMKGKVES